MKQTRAKLSIGPMGLWPRGPWFSGALGSQGPLALRGPWFSEALGSQGPLALRGPSVVNLSLSVTRIEYFHYHARKYLALFCDKLIIQCIYSIKVAM